MQRHATPQRGKLSSGSIVVQAPGICQTLSLVPLGCEVPVFGNDQACQQPGQCVADEIYRSVAGGVSPPIPVGKVGDYAGGEARDSKERDTPRVAPARGLA